MKKKVLLTGGSGFIGRNVVELLGADYELWSPGRRELDLLDASSVQNYFEAHHPDVLIDAAVTPGHRNAKPTVPILESNLRMFFNLLAQRSRFGLWIHLGSGAEYDMANYQPKMKESYFGSHIPADPSGFSKFISSRLIEADPSAINLRLFGVYGKYEDYEIRFISNAICKTLLDQPISIKQNRRFDYLYVNDLAPILKHFIENKPKHRVYNVTPDQAVELKGLAELVRDVAGKPLLPIEMASGGLGAEYSGDNGRLREEIPRLTLTPVRQAVEELFQWYSERRTEIRRDALLVDK